MRQNQRGCNCCTTKATVELNSAIEKVGDLKKEARILEARIQRLKNEGDRAKAGEA